MPMKTVTGPFVVVDGSGEMLRDANGALREFSTEKRATAFLRPGDKVIVHRARLQLRSPA